MSLPNHDWVQQLHGTVICHRCGVFKTSMAPLFCYFPATDPTDIKSLVEQLTEARANVEKLTNERDAALDGVHAACGHKHPEGAVCVLESARLVITRTHQRDRARAEVKRLRETIRAAQDRLKAVGFQITEHGYQEMASVLFDSDAADQE